MPSQPRHLIDHLAGPADIGPGESLGDDVRFRSPFADYTGSDDVAHLMGLIREVLTEVRPARRLSEGATTMTLFEARVSGEEVQGVLCEQRDDADRVIDAMLTVRPYTGLRAAMQAMGALLEASPLPSSQD
jgi:hypothetical protein